MRFESAGSFHSAKPNDRVRRLLVSDSVLLPGRDLHLPSDFQVSFHSLASGLLLGGRNVYQVVPTAVLRSVPKLA